MRVCVAAHHVELSVENVLSVAPVLNTVIYDQLNHNFLGLIAMERQIFTITGNHVSVFSQPFLHSSLAV